jgi:multidrug resistance efflux pump
MNEETEIQLKTDEVNELLTSIPGWIMRWGITCIFGVMVLALLIAGLIRYPDKLIAETTVTTLNPPARLLARSSGRVAALLVANNREVKKDEVLLVIENSAIYTHVLFAASLLDSLQNQKDLVHKLAQTNGFDTLQLGDLTPGFLAFLKCLNEYRIFCEVNPQEKEIGMINREMETYEQLFVKYKVQEENARQVFELAEKDFARYEGLFRENAIAPKELEDKKREYLNAKQGFENIRITHLNSRITLSSLEKNKLQLQMLAFQEKEKYRDALSQSAHSLKSAIESWEQTFLIRAPVAGRVSLFNYWTANQNIHAGDEVMSIVPVKKQELIARLALPVQNSGKLKLNQKVLIKLNNYPYQEYGLLKGFVKTISLLPKDNHYSIEVALPDKLLTSFHKELDYKEEMQGSAEIITDELSLLSRVFYQFRKMTR